MHLHFYSSLTIANGKETCGLAISYALSLSILPHCPQFGFKFKRWLMGGDLIWQQSTLESTANWIDYINARLLLRQMASVLETTQWSVTWGFLFINPQWFLCVRSYMLLVASRWAEKSPPTGTMPIIVFEAIHLPVLSYSAHAFLLSEIPVHRWSWKLYSKHI